MQNENNSKSDQKNTSCNCEQGVSSSHKCDDTKSEAKDSQTKMHSQSNHLNQKPISDSDLAKKCEEYKNDLQRLAAEFDNYKKRVEKQFQVSRQIGREDVLLELLSLCDEFSQALANSKTDKDALEGLKMLAKKMNLTISAFGIEEIACNKEPDPNFHEVILQVPGKNKGEICTIFRKGYKVGGRLLRPAQVSVYSGESDDKNSNIDSEVNSNKTNANICDSEKTENKN